MASVPFLSRLHFTEYLALLFSFLALFLESFVRSVTLLLPTPIIHFFYRVSRNAFNTLSSPYSRRARNRKKAVSSPIAHAQDFAELCELFGYEAEEHIVQTGDGYLLGLHRLGRRQDEADHDINAGPGSAQKKVVYLHHGLLMNSEVWVCLTEKQRCLPFVLVEQGYDVWLGNNRGNKYSKKSLHHAPTDVQFWNFSIDQFAFHDIPDSINYILETTGQPSLTYIGFSQGTAQAFATLSIHPTLNNKVDVFVALAPAMAPPGLASGIVASLCKSNPSVIFLAFGRRAILSSTTMWQALLYPAIFVWFIDKCLLFLFGWRTANITPHQKLAAYPHLYSFTSTKSVVHWFQIIRNGTFQMYDDEVTTPLAVGNTSKYYKVAKFPTRNIRTPIVLLYGGSDSLVDIKLMLKELPRHTIARGIPKYEHLDFLWASDVDKLVFPHVLEALERYAVPERSKLAALGWRNIKNSILDRVAMASGESPNGSLPPGYSEDEKAVKRTALPGDAAAYDFGQHGDQGSTADEYLNESDMEDDEDEARAEEDNDDSPERFALTPAKTGNVVSSSGQDGNGTSTHKPVRHHHDHHLNPSPSIFNFSATAAGPAIAAASASGSVSAFGATLDGRAGAAPQVGPVAALNNSRSSSHVKSGSRTGMSGGMSGGDRTSRTKSPPTPRSERSSVRSLGKQESRSRRPKRQGPDSRETARVVRQERRDELREKRNSILSDSHSTSAATSSTITPGSPPLSSRVVAGEGGGGDGEETRQSGRSRPEGWWSSTSTETEVSPDTARARGGAQRAAVISTGGEEGEVQSVIGSGDTHWHRKKRTRER